MQVLFPPSARCLLPALSILLLGASGRVASPTDALLEASRARWEGVAEKIWDFSETAL